MCIIHADPSCSCAAVVHAKIGDAFTGAGSTFALLQDDDAATAVAGESAAAASVVGIGPDFFPAALPMAPACRLGGYTCFWSAAPVQVASPRGPLGIPYAAEPLLRLGAFTVFGAYSAPVPVPARARHEPVSFIIQ